MRGLLGGLAPELDPALVESVIARAEGIPLYAIELVRMVRASDHPAAAPGALAIPPSLHALVAARLDALEPGDRALLQDAAVLGQAFTVGALAAVSGRPEREIEARLPVLARREFLTRDVDPRSPERGQYAFVQGVVREVAYSTLARRDRRVRHLAAARHFERLEDDSLATVLASHYLEAYRAAPDDEQGRAIRTQARLALRAAADRSARLHNYAQAVRDLERALELSDDEAERAALLLRQAELAVADAKYEPAIALAERARAAYEVLGDSGRARSSVALVGEVELLRGHDPEAGALFRDALAGLEPGDDPEAFARLASQLARVYVRSDQGAEGAVWAERALEAAGPLRLVEIVAEALNTRGVCVQSLNRLDESIALIRAAADLAAAHGLSAAEIRARFNLGGRLFAEDPAEGARVLRAAFETALRTGRREWLLACANFLGRVLVMLGDLDGRLEVLDQVPEDVWTTEARADSLVVRAQVAADRGEVSATRQLLAEAHRLIGDALNTQRRWDWATAETDIAVTEGRLDDAERLSHEIGGNFSFWGWALRSHVALRRGDAEAARREIEAPGFTGQQGRAMDVDRGALRAALALLDGQRDAALSGLRQAVRSARELGIEWFVGEVLVDAICILGGDDPEAVRLAEEIRPMYARAGDRAHLERIDEALRPTRRADVAAAAATAASAEASQVPR